MTDFIRDNAVECATVLFFILLLVWGALPFMTHRISAGRFVFRGEVALAVSAAAYSVAFWWL